MDSSEFDDVFNDAHVNARRICRRLFGPALVENECDLWSAIFDKILITGTEMSLGSQLT